MGGSESCRLNPGQFSDFFSCYIHLLRALVLLLSLGLVGSPSCACFSSGFGSLQDQKLFREAGGWKLVDAVAQYWCSRMVWSEEEQCYHIKGTSATARPVCREGVFVSRGSEPLQSDLAGNAWVLQTLAL